MEQFVHQQNLWHYLKMLSEKTNEPQRQQILILLAEEEAKDQSPPAEVSAVG